MKEYNIKGIVAGFTILKEGEAKLTFEVALSETPKAAEIAMLQQTLLDINIKESENQTIGGKDEKTNNYLGPVR